MNLFNFLKSKAGKFVMGVSQAAGISAVVGVLSVSVMYNTASKQLEEAPVRTSLSSPGSYNYEGMNRRADGMLTSMNIQNRAGSKGVAVGADRERLEGNRTNNDFGLTAADNLGSRISALGAGSAAATSSTDGLGSSVDMVEVGPGVSYSRASAPGVNVGGIAQGSRGGQQAPAASSAATSAGSSGGKLGSASMARASGNAFNAAAGSMGGGSSSGGTSGRGGSSARGGSEGHTFSGAMPGGSSSNIISSHADAGLGRGGRGSGFIAGGRDSKIGKGRQTLPDPKDLNDLRDISKRSAAAARNSHRAANEGSRAFLASAQNSGGMMIEGGGETVSTGSADFEAPNESNLRAIGDWGEAEDDYGDRKAAARKKLTWMWLGTMAGGIALLYTAAAILTAIKNLQPSPASWVYPVVATAFCLAMAVPCFFLVREAIFYQRNFNDGTSDVLMSIISYLTAGVLMGGMIFTCIKPEVAWKWLTGKLTTILIGFGVSVGLGLVMNTMMSGFSGK